MTGIAQGALSIPGGSILRHLAGRMLIALFFVTTALTLALVLSQIIPLLEPILRWGMPAHVIWLALPSFIPAIIYLAFPAFLAIALARVYDQAIRDNEVTALLAAGLSKFNVATPGLAVAVLAMGISLLNSAYLIPASYERIHDAKYQVRNYISYRMLPENRFIQVTKGLVIYIYRWADERTVEEIFIVDRSKKSESRVLFARKGQFIEEPGNLILVLEKGRIDVLTNSRNTRKYNSIKFDRLSQHLPLLRRGIKKQRGWRHAHEQPIGVLLDPPARVQRFEADRQSYRRELFRRLGAPLLCLSYGVFIIGGLLTGVGRRYSRLRLFAGLTAVVGGVHLGFFVALSGLDLYAPLPIALFVALVAFPFVAGMWMLLKANRRPSMA